MALAIFLGPGDFYWFLAISVVTGLGLGADYGLPPSILADVINSPEGGDTKGKTGTYFGLWALATKLATAIGAAVSLPVAALLGFNPAQGQYSTTALIIVYIVLPVVIKIGRRAADLVHPHRGRARLGARRDDEEARLISESRSLPRAARRQPMAAVDSMTRSTSRNSRTVQGGSTTSLREAKATTAAPS